MKAKPLKARTPGATGAYYTSCEPEEATHVEMLLPGCFPNRIVPVVRRENDPQGPVWSWNGSTERPTLNPSVLTWTDSERCHCFIRDGRVQFLNDCSHQFAGQTVDLLDV